MRFCFVTTFPNKAWGLYAAEALQSLVKHLPASVKICVGLDDQTLKSEVEPVLRPGDAVLAGWQPDHLEFITRNAARDHASDYRLKATPFSHKIFFLKRFFDQESADYIVWWDADALLTKPVTEADLIGVMPGKDETVSYLGRKDWDHSECGFMGFNKAHAGAKAILDFMHYYYVSGTVFSLPQWHDSYLFDVARNGQPCRNISEGVPGNNVWAATKLGEFSEHRKGFEAKQRGRALTDHEFYTPPKKA
jgi:hypothetical protein